jgi:hypothetical protein
MRVRFKGKRLGLRLIVPNWILSSKFIIKKIFKDDELTIQIHDLMKLVRKELKKIKKDFPKLELVRIEEHEGHTIIIRL